jgi:hypothetical protein
MNDDRRPGNFMNPNQKPEEDDALNGVLREWRVKEALPPRFEEEVWQRISRAEAQPQRSLRGAFTQWVEAIFVKPKFAFSYVALLLAFGVAGGSWAAQRENVRVETTLGTRYVQSVDPYQATAMNR